MYATIYKVDVPGEKSTRSKLFLNKVSFQNIFYHVFVTAFTFFEITDGPLVDASFKACRHT